MERSASEKLLDIEEIRKLRILYSHYLDSNDVDNLMTLFTEDAVCDFGFGLWHDHDTFRKNWAEVHRQYDKNGKGTYPYMHAICNHWIELTGPDIAEGRCYLTDWVTADAKGNPLLLLAVYADEYKRDGGRWKFNRCRIDYIWPDRNVGGGHPGQGLQLPPERAAIPKDG
jgi:hypothetical protein